MNWERSVIGTAIAYPESMKEAEHLLPSDFTKASHRILWAEMLALHRRDSLEKRTLIEVLRERGELDGLGGDIEEAPDGEEYIEYLKTFRGQNMYEYASRVEDASVKKHVQEIGAIIIANAQVPDMTSDELLDDATQRVLSARRRRLDAGLEIGQIVSEFETVMEDMRDGTYVPAWTPNTIGLKEVIGHISRTDNVLIANRPGGGKSSFLRHEALKTAAEWDKWVVIFNMENDELEYAKWFVSHLTGINSRKLADPASLRGDELETIRRAANALSGMPIKIITLSAPTVEEVLRHARAQALQKEVGLFMLDYIQLIRNNINNRAEDLSKTTSLLRGFSLGNKIPIISAAQLNREIAHRGDNAEPHLSDLRESGSLEQDSTMVWFIHNIWHSPTDEDLAFFPENIDGPTGRVLPTINAIPIEIIVAKNRNGPTGRTGPIKWVKSNNRFFTLTR